MTKKQVVIVVCLLSALAAAYAYAIITDVKYRRLIRLRDDYSGAYSVYYQSVADLMCASLRQDEGILEGVGKGDFVEMMNAYPASGAKDNDVINPKHITSVRRVHDRVNRRVDARLRDLNRMAERTDVNWIDFFVAVNAYNNYLEHNGRTVFGNFSRQFKPQEIDAVLNYAGEDKE